MTFNCIYILKNLNYRQQNDYISWMVTVKFTKQYLLSLFNCKFLIQYFLWKQVKSDAATAVTELVMMGGKTTRKMLSCK
jgi:hypothetical protein